MEGDNLKENTKGFWNLLLLIVSCVICISAPQEIIHLFAIKEYWLGLFILVMTICFFNIGVSAYTIVKEQIKSS